MRDLKAYENINEYKDFIEKIDFFFVTYISFRWENGKWEIWWWNLLNKLWKLKSYTKKCKYFL